MMVLPFSILGGELKIASTLDQARQLRGRGNIDGSIKVLKNELSAVVEEKGTDSDPGETAQRALDDSDKLADLSRKQARLYYGLEEVKAATNFKPISEAPLPEGFPPPGEVGKIIVKEYPAYRAARTAMNGMGDDNGAFGKLFRHISSNNVKMTAPVEMTYEHESVISMAFLYAHPKLGETRKEGDVDVVDFPAVTVVSIGLRGNYSDERHAAAVKKLQAWLDQHRDEYESAGPSRLMGYNSPFVLPMLRYAEAQIPIRTK
jgi:hypothetical protein